MSDPWMKFYPSDWRADPALRLCTRAARGLWIDMLSIMHEAKPRGELRIGQVALDADKLARAIGEPADEVKTDLKELEAAGVFSRRKNGVIYSRRMVRDEEKRRKLRENGKKGGNPSLRKQTINGGLDNQPDKTTEARSQKPEAPYSPPRDKGAYSDRFEAWWKSYPRKLNASKKRASTAFERLPEALKAQAESALPAFRRSMAKTEEQFIPHPSTWLNERRFETVAAEAGEDAGDETWLARLAHWAGRGTWSEKWGPDPNSPACKAPAELIRQAQERAA